FLQFELSHFLDEFEIPQLLFDPSMADYVIKYYIYIYSRSILDCEEQYGEIKFYIIELEK
ncbi:MAG: hypothetical protein WBX81_01685, partial [Nitrososphaeraceae archaeon]